jgi:hypothetical protein
MTAPSLTITRPDDWHLHLRDGEAMRSIVGATARVFSRAVVMPNLRPPVTTVDNAAAYRERVAGALPANSRFAPLMTLYLTDHTSTEEIVKARKSGFVIGIKYYPAGATTNSESGVTDLARVWPVLAAMEQAGLPLLVHGEVTDPGVDVFDRERVFVEGPLTRIVDAFPALKVVVEHITTAEAADFVAAASANVAATITPQHLLYSRSALFAGGVAAPLLPADIETRSPSSGDRSRRDQRQSEVFPWYRFRAACEAYEGKLMLRSGLLLRTRRARALRRGIRSRRRAGSARGIRELPRRRLLWIAAKHGYDHAAPRVLEGPGSIRIR